MPGSGMRHFLRAAALVFCLTGIAVPSWADKDLPALPDRIPTEAGTLVIAASGVRDMLFWDLYRLAIYVPAGRSVQDLSSDPAMPRCLHLQLMIDGPPPKRIPKDWREALKPILSETEYDAIISHYRKLRKGDTLTVAFNGTETESRFNETTFMKTNGAGLADAFFGLYLGDDPVSDDLKEELMAQQQPAKNG